MHESHLNGQMLAERPLTAEQRAHMGRTWATCPEWCDGEHFDVPVRLGVSEHSRVLGWVGPVRISAKLVIGSTGSREVFLDVEVDAEGPWRIPQRDAARQADDLHQSMIDASRFLSQVV